MKIKVSLGVSLSPIYIVIRIKLLLEDNEIWVSINASLRIPISKVNMKIGCKLLRKFKNVHTHSKE